MKRYKGGFRMNEKEIAEFVEVLKKILPHNAQVKLKLTPINNTSQWNGFSTIARTGISLFAAAEL